MRRRRKKEKGDQSSFSDLGARLFFPLEQGFMCSASRLWAAASGIEVFGDVMYLHTRGIFVESVSFSWHHSVKGSLKKGSNIDE